MFMYISPCPPPFGSPEFQFLKENALPSDQDHIRISGVTQAAGNITKWPPIQHAESRSLSPLALVDCAHKETTRSLAWEE